MLEGTQSPVPLARHSLWAAVMRSVHTLISPTQIANANEVKLPQSKAVTAAVDKDVAKLRGIAKRHAKQHETVVAISLPWEKLAGIIQHWGQEESNKCLRSLEATSA